MRFHFVKSSLNKAVGLTIVLLLGASLALAQQQVNLTAGPSTLTLPDGNVVPMWGYSCGAVVSGSTATCAKLNPTAPGWSPVVITVPTNATGGLAINLTNSLQFPIAPATPVNSIPTSIVIMGQLGGGLGQVRTTTASPTHSAQGATWPIAAPPDTGGNTTGNATFNPPSQGPRVQSMATEVAGGTTALLPAWSNLRPGTYLLESGTHPSIQAPMGLYGILVVTAAPGATAGTAYPGVNYNAEVAMLLSEIDPVQNNAVQTAVNSTGFSATAVWSGRPGDCGDAAVHTCYPPAVNYTPLYYLVNGQAFDKTVAVSSLFPTAPPSGVSLTGTVLVRLVNAGLRMHVPSIVGSVTGAAAASGFSLIAEDGNVFPDVARAAAAAKPLNLRVQSEVFMPAGKTYDVMINVPAAGSTALPIFDRELSLSGNATSRDNGMLAYISINNAQLPVSPAFGAAAANPDQYSLSCQSTGCKTLTVSDVSLGVIANDVNVFGVKVVTAPTSGTLTLNTNGTFTYIPSGASWSSDSFVYQANGSGPTATVTLTSVAAESSASISCTAPSFNASSTTYFATGTPGVLAFCKDAGGYALTVDPTTVQPVSGLSSVVADVNGGFTAKGSAAQGTFTFQPKNSQGTLGPVTTATVNFPAARGLKVTVMGGSDKTPISDYRWIIEEDRTFYVDPNCTTNNPTTLPAGCPSGIVPTFGTNFHTSYMPVVATGCTGPLSCESGQTVLGKPAVCDVTGVCSTDSDQQTAVDPSEVAQCTSTLTTNCLDPNKRYYISVLPGDAANPFIGGNGSAPANCAKGAYNADGSLNTDCGHGMGGAPIAKGQTAVTILTQPTPFPPAQLSVFVFQDDFPLNGEQDAGGGIDVLATNEPGLGGFQITLFDDAGGTGDATGQPTYDMFNMPLSNSLSGTIDPATGLDACPISKNATTGFDGTKGNLGITGMIVTCPKFEADGVTPSPLAGQAVIANLYPGRYGVVATPAADRIARGEEWLQTNTLDGQKAHDSFLRIGEPAYFQEFGPAGYHVSIGFANPKIIQSRLAGVCAGTDLNVTGVSGTCNNTVKGQVTTERMSRTPDERLYSSGDYSSFSFTQCYVSLGDPDGEDFAFTKCNADGTFSMSGLPAGDWRITVFDQWNDMLVDGLSTPVALGGANSTTDMGEIAMNQWQANIYTSTFFDKNGDGVREDGEDGLALVATNIRFRDGSYSNFNNTDLSGNAGFNEVFPLFSWYVVETDSTRYKNTGTHVVYDTGGPADKSNACGNPGVATCGTSNIGAMMARTYEDLPLPGNLHFPGAVYCNNADCSGQSIANGPNPTSTPNSTGRIDPPWVLSEAWQGFSGQNSFIEFGKTPFAAGENGGIRGHVIYASTRPFDDPTLLLQLSWEPLVPNVTINLYQEGTAQDGSQTLTLVDTTKTSSFDDWAQGFRSDGVPNMNCPGQGTASGTDADIFFFTLFNQPMWLDVYNNSGTPQHTIPYNSQYKCYDGMHNWNQVQPAPYDGMYQFPSIAGRDPVSGKPVGGTNANVAGTYCTICIANPTDGTPMLPAGKYVVEVVVPPGYELVKEEDKNILIGDNYIAPVTQQFAGLGNIFILPDQAEVGSAYNGYNSQNATQDLGRTTFPSQEGDTGSVEAFWPCVGQSRTVPDYISLFPQSQEVSPFAGATRNLCDRKEVTLADQASVLAKFYIFTSTHAAAHFTGVITDDFTSEFDPFSPQFGEKFSPPNMPIAIKDWTGTEISRVYADQWGTYNGLTYSTWEVNPPNPTGYAPTMMVTCMNDPGTGPTPDPLYNPQYSDFCYEIPFMPGQTQYMDTPVVPTSAFAGAGYNNPDCSYPDLTPAIASVLNTNAEQGLPALSGPWVSAAGGSHSLTINSLGKQDVPSYAYAGPSASTSPFNQKKVTRNYGFGGTKGTVTIGGVDATPGIISWSDSQIVVTVPSGLPPCGITQQAQYGGSAASCGELVITAAGGQQSVDTVTVTVGGKQPTLVTQTIQSAIDAASPGDMIIVPPGTYQELLLMWKPVRLQGVGAASSIINANTQPAGKLDPWRSSVNCLFGLARNGQPNSGGNPFDPTGVYSCPSPSNSNTAGGIGPDGNVWNYFYGGPNYPTMVVDRIPLEGILGWDATVNGNLAEQLQEPSIMGAYEGAGITVLSKGVNIPANSTDIFGSGAEASFPTGTALLTANSCTTSRSNQTNPFPSNFQCNPSSIDGLGITNSSQGGGGVFVHAWAHNLQIANNRVYSNAGTLSGGLAIGQGESPEAYLNGSTPDTDPGSCISGTGLPANTQLPYCLNLNVNIHNNNISHNSSTGDELFSGTPAGAGGISICTGADYYKFNYNWVCGNLSTGDGGGIGHLGFSYYGDIEHNSILFNQSTNPTIPANGGGLIIMGAAPDTTLPNGTECGSVTDNDCVPGLSDGTGPGLVINANLIMGNAADSGTGGGLRFQAVNGTDISRFPNPTSGLSRGANCSSQASCDWYVVSVTNNIIADNVAGWDGAGVSLEDSLVVNFVNNTVSSNDTTASSGVLFNTLGAPLASSQSPSPTCTANCGTTSAPQPAGFVSLLNSPQLTSSFTTGPITCPAGHPNCTKLSYPLMFNDVFWQNRSFYIGVGSLGAGTLNQQNVVTLLPTLSQTTTGQCVSGLSSTWTTGGGYWDIGVRGDSGPTNHAQYTLNPINSVLTAGYSGSGNINSDPKFMSQYCNGSRVPPEATCKSVTGQTIPCGYQAPAGISDATVPNPIFNLTPSATVDEGNNWINLSWGPLALTDPVHNLFLGNYAPNAGSSVINAGTTSSSGVAAPPKDFFDHTRTGTPDIGAIEVGAGSTGGGGQATVSITPNPLRITVATPIGNLGSGTGVVTLTNTTAAGGASVSVTNVAVTSGTGSGLASWFFNKEAGGDHCTGVNLAPGASCTVTVRFSNVLSPTGVDRSGTITFTDSATGSPQSGALIGHANP